MTRRILIFLFLLIPALLFSQGTKPVPDGNKKEVKYSTSKSKMFVQAKYSDQFRIKSVYFNRRLDIGGRGEILEIEILIENLTDDPIDLYIFTTASYEIDAKTHTSFDRPVPPRKRIKNFVVFPDDISNFKYAYKDKEGKTRKDVWGKDITSSKNIRRISKRD